ncbi:hypothetical protein BVRB_6g138940 [Beta vulgaris subsp. vulgaris]|nr:hypothetical protein BVRB_6g138940 [Beta vulgaris subsp. vulgaris]
MMEFEDEHEEEEEEEEEEQSSEMAITPTFKKNQQQQNLATTTATTTVRYRECLKNHAVGIGGHAVDGCGEFMPAGTEGSIDALRCAACNCHRNFHRKENLPDNNVVNSSSQLTLYTPRPHSHQIYQFYPYNRTTPGYLHVSGGQRPLALPSPTMNQNHHYNNQQQQQKHEEMVVGRDEVVNNNNNNHGHHISSTTTGVGEGGTMDISGGTMLSGGSNSSGKKRFRTKFTQEQKDKMLDLAEKLGWKIQKQDELVVHQFCHETGVKRHVLKVWMHNNKLTLGKKP